MSNNEIEIKNIEEIESVAFLRHRELPMPIALIPVIITIIALVSVVISSFHLMVFGKGLLETSYYFILIACLLSQVFLFFPAKKGQTKLPFYDILLSFIAAGICFYLFLKSDRILYGGWDILPPRHVGIMNLVLFILILEAARRLAGKFFFGIALFFAIFPIFAGYMPGLLRGIQYTFARTVNFHILGAEGILGIPLRTIGSLLIGYLVFGVVLNATGGGTFFFNISQAIFGTSRGGAAKVAVVASAIFGSISGSALANVITTGSITIPSMKKSGFPSYYAGAVEACASTGGTLMPPVMGAVAFVMASITGISYPAIALAAFVPSFLFYMGLFIQVDSYSAKNNLKGLPKSQIPLFWQTMKEGWVHILSFAVLLYFLFWESRTAQAPLYASVVSLAFSMISKKSRLTLKEFFQLFISLGKTLAEIIGILCAVGLIISSLSMTGVAHSFSYEVIRTAGGSLPLLLALGAMSAFVLGMGMTSVACYVLLALVLAPALVASGVNMLGAHLYVVYWGMISFITPPVALASYGASSIAGADPMKTSFASMRLGLVIYIVPVLFVLSPELILQGALLKVIIAIVFTVAGMIAIAMSLEGYFYSIGRIDNGWIRIAVFLLGLAICFPWWGPRIGGLLILAGLYWFIRKTVVVPAE